jgi:hypothetical protein
LWDNISILEDIIDYEGRIEALENKTQTMTFDDEGTSTITMNNDLILSEGSTLRMDNFSFFNNWWSSTYYSTRALSLNNQSNNTVFTLDQSGTLTLTGNINAIIHRFTNYTDSTGNVFEIGNGDENDSRFGGYITVHDSESQQEGGICMNGFNPQMYTKNTFVSPPNRTLFEIHNDGAYISHSTAGETWIRLQEASSQDNTLYGLYNGGLQAISASSTNY